MRVLESETFEEANSDFVNWMKQRSRWLKGYLQTFAVHLRQPRELKRELGWKGLMHFTMFVGGTPILAIINPIFWMMTIFWFVAHPAFIEEIFPAPIYYLGLLSWSFGNFLLVYVTVMSCRVSNRGELLMPALLVPLYWIMMSMAAVKAVSQLVGAPDFWEKTVHGLHHDHRRHRTSGSRCPRWCRRALADQQPGVCVGETRQATVVAGDGDDHLADFPAGPNWRPGGLASKRRYGRIQGPADGSPASVRRRSPRSASRSNLTDQGLGTALRPPPGRGWRGRGHRTRGGRGLPDQTKHSELGIGPATPHGPSPLPGGGRVRISSTTSSRPWPEKSRTPDADVLHSPLIDDLAPGVTAVALPPTLERPSRRRRREHTGRRQRSGVATRSPKFEPSAVVPSTTTQTGRPHSRKSRGLDEQTS